jgi:hypothetical protein
MNALIIAILAAIAHAGLAVWLGMALFVLVLIALVD